MSEANVHLRVEQVADVTVISVLDRRVRVDLSESFEEEVVKAMERLERPKVLLEFAGVEFLSSAVLGKLIKLNGKVATREGQLKLCALHPRIAEVFKITSLDRLFDIHKTRDAALKAFK